MNNTTIEKARSYFEGILDASGTFSQAFAPVAAGRIFRGLNEICGERIADDSANGIDRETLLRAVVAGAAVAFTLFEEHATTGDIMRMRRSVNDFMVIAGEPNFSELGRGSEEGGNL